MTDPTPKNFEQEPRQVDEIAALDADRTVIHTDAVADLLLDSLALYGVDNERIDEAHAYERSQKGSSLDLLTYIEAEFSVAPDDLMENILANVGEEMKQVLLYPGADRLISSLVDRGLPLVIFTHGKPKYQDFKIRLIRNLLDMFAYELPAIITSTKNKSNAILTEWLDDDGCLKGEAREKLGYLQPASIVVVDDKEEHLAASDERLGAILIDNDNEGTEGAMSLAELADAVEDGISLMDAAEVYSDHRAKLAS